MPAWEPPKATSVDSERRPSEQDSAANSLVGSGLTLQPAPGLQPSAFRPLADVFLVRIDLKGYVDAIESHDLDSARHYSSFARSLINPGIFNMVASLHGAQTLSDLGEASMPARKVWEGLLVTLNLIDAVSSTGAAENRKLVLDAVAETKEFLRELSRRPPYGDLIDRITVELDTLSAFGEGREQWPGEGLIQPDAALLAAHWAHRQLWTGCLNVWEKLIPPDCRRWLIQDRVSAITARRLGRSDDTPTEREVVQLKLCNDALGRLEQDTLGKEIR